MIKFINSVGICYNMSKLLKIVFGIIGVNDEEYDTNYEMLISQGWEERQSWEGLVMYQKGDERVIYNPQNDEVVRRY